MLEAQLTQLQSKQAEASTRTDKPATNAASSTSAGSSATSSSRAQGELGANVDEYV